MHDRSLTPEEIETIRQCPLFAGIKEEDFSQILNMEGSIAVYEKGEQVVAEDMLPIVLKGRGYIKKSAADGHEFLLDNIAPSRAVGLATLFLKNTVLSRIYAKETLTLLLFPKKKVEAMLEIFPVFRINYISYLSGRIAFLTRKIEQFTDHSAENRLLTYIRQNCNDHGVLTVPSFKNLALLLNIGRASLYRALDNLKEQGIIQAQGRHITFMNH